MSLGGTFLYDLDDESVPPLVRRAVGAAVGLGFELCVHPGTGRLLQVLAAGVPAGGSVGETGTGTGAGLAWMVSGARPDVRFLSAEIDADRAAAAREVFADHANVRIIDADSATVFGDGPFDLLVHDGGPGSGKGGDEPVDPSEVLTEGGVMTVDDYTPMEAWPPMFDGSVDQSRLHWLTHPDLLATEVRVAPHMAVVVGRRTSGHG